ncbi:MAG TPA: hypothetical protein DDZ57_10055 [Porphyromonadaceae bacterium]|jgi:hypothetical protein|nr:hypothetical protein [Porphyromonadaceae bacterium]
MKISLLLNLGQALIRNANLDKMTIMLYSFIDYCNSHEFTYPLIPRVGEFISLEEFVIEWAKSHDDSELYILDNINSLTACIGSEIKVINVVHNINRSVLYCSDLYKLE